MPTRSRLRRAVRALAAGLAVVVAVGASTPAPATAAPPLALPVNPVGVATTQPAPGPTIAVGPDHACAVVAGGVRCWGDNAAGGLGDGTRTPRMRPVSVLSPDARTPFAGVVAVAAGLGFTCALRTDRRVWCWGAGRAGQLGTGASLDSRLPTPVATLSNATAITAGRSHACAIRATGALVCWGSNVHGELGDGTTRGRALPVPVAGLGPVALVAAGDAHTCAVPVATTSVRCWGANAFGQLGTGAFADQHRPAGVSGIFGSVSALAAGGRHSCAFTTADTPFGTIAQTLCWGDDRSGQVSGTPGGRVARAVSTFSAGDTRILVAGDAFTCASGGSGTACWGANSQGQAGDGSRSRSALPSRTGLGTVDSLAAGGATACAAIADPAWTAAAWCWGANRAGQVGDGTRLERAHPRQIIALASDPPLSTMSGSLGVAVTGYSSCAIQPDRTVRCWGDNSVAELGDSTADVRPVPVTVLLLSHVAALAAGAASTCATLESGVIRCWGDNQSGQLGDGTVNTRSSPVLLRGITNPRSLGIGQAHSCAVLADGTAECWGAGGSGQLGNGSLRDRRSPVLVTGLADATQIAPGDTHTCALLGDGSVRCWGDNSFGQLGDGTLDNRLAPVAVRGLADVRSVVARGSTVCALKVDGTLWCWGDNTYGQLGSADLPLSAVPVQVPGIAGATAVAVGADHACALLGDGQVSCWGDNSMGQLGVGSFATKGGPVVVGRLAGVTAIAAGGGHTCAIAGAGAAVRCWGTGDSGQIGNGLPFHAWWPAPVVLP